MTIRRSLARRVTGVAIMMSIALATGALAAGLGSYSGGSSGRGGGIGGGGSSSGGGGELGLGNFAGSRFRLTVALQTGYDDNIFTNSVVSEGSAFTNGSIGLSYTFGSPRTQLELHMGGGATYYWDRPQQPGADYNGFLSLILQHKFSARLSLEVTSYSAYQEEPDFSLDIGSNRRTGGYFYTSDRFRLSYLWTPRFSTVTTYNITTLLYGSDAASFQNRVENTAGNEFRYLILPTTTLIGEYRIGFVTYFDNGADSITHYFLAGAEHSFSPRFNFSLRAGIQIREFEDSAFASSSGSEPAPYFESSVTYVLNQRSDVTWTNRYGFQEGDLTTNQNRTEYHTGLNLKYGVTPRITTRLALFYDHDAYDSQGSNSGFDQNAVDAALSVRYAISRYLGIEVGYNHTQVFSDANGRGYSRNRIHGGIDFIF